MSRITQTSIPIWLALIMALSPMHRPLSAQEYRFEAGGYAGAASYLGDANRRLPFVPIGAAAGGAFRYNHNFRLAFAGELGYTLFRYDTRYAQTHYPAPDLGGRTARGQIHAVSLQGWAEYNFAHYSDKYRYLQTRSLVPYIGSGLSIGTTVGENRMALLPGIGLKTGIKYKVKNRLNLIVSLQGIYYLSDRLDATGEQSAWLDNPYGMPADWIKGKDASLALMISLTYEFGKRSEPCRGADRLNGSSRTQH